jgi:hypothetical protein
MESADYLYKTKPNYVFMVFMIAGAVFFIFLSSLSLPVKDNNIAAIVFLILFGLFAMACLSLAIGFKIYYLTQTEIIITIPLVLYKRVILLSDIKSLSDQDVKVDLDPKSFVRKDTLIGHKVIVLLNDEKKIQLSSLQIWKYKDFRKNLRTTLINNGRKTHQ